MKLHTLNVLETCTDLLVAAQMKRKRRGLAVWQLNQEMWGGVCLQHQDYADGVVKIDTFPQVYWAPVQKIYALANGEKYDAFKLPFRSRLWSFQSVGEPALYFAPNVPPSAELLRLQGLIREHVLSKVLDLADEASITSFFRDEVRGGGGKPELFMAFSAWKSRSVLLDKEFDWVVSELSHQQFINSVTVFYERLRSSAEVFSLLQG